VTACAATVADRASTLACDALPAIAPRPGTVGVVAVPARSPANLTTPLVVAVASGVAATLDGTPSVNVSLSGAKIGTCPAAAVSLSISTTASRCCDG
jgi:hypothetical protein